MASVNIYVSEELKARMNKANLNWSEICRRAIEGELARAESQSTEATEVPRLPSNQRWQVDVIDEEFLAKGTVIEVPYRGQPKKVQIDMLKDWFEQTLNQFISAYSFGQASLKNLVSSGHKTQILIPGQGWTECYLYFEPRFLIKHPVFKESDETQLSE
ncbi:MAG: hypothetical protein ACTS2F_07690 [Thainema sp.]